MNQVHEGDRVAFNIGNNQLEGTVTEVMTQPTFVEGRVAHASKEDPRFAVVYDGTGVEQIRTADTIEKIPETRDSTRVEVEANEEKNIHEGDRVAFNIGQHIMEGSVTEVLTSPKEVEGRIAHASKEYPRYTVMCEGTGTEVIRTEEGIMKLESEEEEEKSPETKKHIKVGDRVSFHVGENKLEGTVTQVMTSPTEVDGRVAHASKDDPRFAVQYDGTGKEMIRTEEGIEKIEGEVHEGDRVSFHVGENKVRGTVTQVLTSPKEVDGRVAHASKDDPRYAVQCDGTGREIIRKEVSLEREENMEVDSTKRKRVEEEGKKEGKGKGKQGREPETKKKRTNRAAS